ncbi:hypothetical protein GW17_00024926 [Ensete ventricosum]|nr:hypothetical protein GW17_00024926 [Ensete ventricosum]RZS18317.1 hypothetical protein BHM03_00050561 [Ensete ventricosum]
MCFSHFMLLSKDCNFDLYRPVGAVCTGPPGYQYTDRLLPGGTAKIDRRRSIEGEKGKKKKKRKRRKKKKKRREEERSTSCRPRLRAIAAHGSPPEQLLDSGTPSKDTASTEPPQRVGLKWAHSIPVPETGCVLVATEKLDGVPSFERTVVLLLRLGSRDPRDGPFGVILNRPLHRKIKDMKPSNPNLATIFADCSVHFGGPLEANMFLLRMGDGAPLPGLEEVISGVCFGARNSLDEAAALVKKGVLRPHDFRFFVGYAGWQFDQLLDEIESNYWVVAACSSHLMDGATVDPSSNLWEEILQLMGGQYSDLSRKPKQDHS